MADKKTKGLLDMLGSGAARKAGDAIARRKAQIDAATGTPAPKKKKKP